MNSNSSGSKTIRQKNVLFSVILVVVVTVFFFIYSGLTPRPNESKLSISFAYIIMRYVFLALAPAVFLLRLARFIKSDHLLLILIAVANMAIGVTAVILHVIDKADLQWLNQCLINLLIGFLLLVTVYFPFKQAR